MMERVEVLFLGTGDAFGSGGRLQSCIFVQSGEVRFLLDCGASALVGLKRYGVDPSGIGLVLLSHLHGDHFGGIPFLILDGQFSRRTQPLLVAGPSGVEGRVREAMEVFFPGSSRVQRKFPVEFAEMKERTESSFGDIRVTPFPVVHSSGAPSFALRVGCGGKEIGYSGDTEWTDSLIEAARGTDLFISECYLFDKKINYHLNYQILKEQKGNLGCRRLILTHMGEDVLKHLPSLGDMELAEDGKRILV
jgi:ribonuclease BN (tRNA processing enzyme)